MTKVKESKDLEQLKQQVVELLMVANGIKPEEFDSEYRVLYIVEGHSAASGIRSKRDPASVGVLALRGKILNCWGKPLTMAMRSEVVKEYLTIMRNSNTAYNRVIITTDADPDGAHITSLLMGITVKFLPDFVKEGKLFICDTPFYIFKIGQNIIDWGNNRVMPPSHLRPYIDKLTPAVKTSFEKETGISLDKLDDSYINEVDTATYDKNMLRLETLCKIKGADCKGLGSYNYEGITKFILYPSLGASFTRVDIDSNYKPALDTSLLHGCKEWLIIDDDANRYGENTTVSIDEL